MSENKILQHQQFSVEEMVILLKQQTNQYNELSDQDKIKNIDAYNKLIKEKDNCAKELEKYKESFIMANKPKDNKEQTQDNNKLNDNLLETSIDKINEIKMKIDNPTAKLHELIGLYEQLTEMKLQLDDCFQNKKMEIVKL